MNIQTFLDDYTSPADSAQRNAKGTIKRVPFTIVDIVEVDMTIIDGSGSAALALRMEMDEWCKEHCKKEALSIRGPYFYAFEDKDDAVVFKLRWG